MRKTIMAVCAGLATACSAPLQPEPAAPVAAARPAHDAAAVAALAERGEYSRAIAAWEAQVRRAPSAALLGNLGYAYYLDGRLVQAQGALEQACLLEPGNALWWERLAALLETMGESSRALEAMRHARLLRERAGARDAELQMPVAAPATPAAPAAPPTDLWPADMARTEVRQVGAGVVELARVPGRAAAVAAAPGLEVSNGNGVRGMAAAVAKRLRAEGMPVSRLSNTLPFDVQHTRVEVREGSAPQLRIVLGKDLATPEIKKPPAGGRRQAP